MLGTGERFVLSANDRRDPWLGPYGALPTGPVSMSPDGSFCVRGTYSSQGAPVLEVYDIRGAGQISTRSLPALPVSIAVSSEGKRIAAALPERILVFDRGPQPSRILAAAVKGVELIQVVLNREGSLLASIDSNGDSICLWNLADGERLATVPSGPTPLEQIVLSGSGRWLAGSIEGGSVRLWDLSVIRQQLTAIGLDWSRTPYIETKRGNSIRDRRSSDPKK